MGKKLTAEIVNERLAEREIEFAKEVGLSAPYGITMTSGYVNLKTSASFICREEHKWETNPENVLVRPVCRVCSGSRLTREIVDERIQGSGFRMNSDFIDVMTVAEFMCAHGHTWSTTPDSLMRGSGCFPCSVLFRKARREEDDVKAVLAARQIEMLDTYKTMNTKTKFRCAFNHTWTTTVASVNGGSGCPDCCHTSPLNIDIVNERLAPRGIRMTSEYVSSGYKSKFICSVGHEWEQKPGAVTGGLSGAGRGCRQCAGLAPLTTEEANQRLRARGVSIVGEHISRSTKTTFKCPMGHEWSEKAGKVLDGMVCPNCNGVRGSDEDIIYIWKIKGISYKGYDVFKFGITSARLGQKRIRNLANKLGVTAEIILFQDAINAREIEKRLKSIGEDPELDISEGHTEVRAWDENDLFRVRKVVEEMAVPKEVASEDSEYFRKRA